MSRTSFSRLRRPLGVAILSALALSLGAGPDAEARGGAVAPPPRPARPIVDAGARYFDECIRWVSRGGAGIGQASDFYVKLNAELDLEQSRHKGPMRLWWKGNGHFRWELTTAGRRLTKILNVNAKVNPPRTQMWIIQGNLFILWGSILY